MPRYKALVEYDGSQFYGWQKQADTTTIQQTIEESLIKFNEGSIDVVAAGRTDAGVHALEQVIHFDLKRTIEPFNLQQAMNSYLRDRGISIFSIERFDNKKNFHARFSAKERTYIYKILNRKYPPTFLNKYVWWIPLTLDVDKMQSCANLLIGTNDLSTFRASGCQASSAVKTINNINFYREGDLICMFISAPSFLYHQVRNIIGSLVLVGLDKWNQETFQSALHSKNRAAGGITAPPNGLYLNKILY